MLFAGGKLKRADTREHLDDFAIVAARKFAVVARGHAGYDAPLASRTVSALTAVAGEDATVIEGAVRQLNATFAREAQDAEWSYGSSFAAIWFDGRRLLVVNVGDAAVWHCRAESAVVLAEPQTLAAELVRAGKLSREDARQHEHGGVLTNVVGNGPSLKCTVTEHRFADGDQFLLSTAVVADDDRDCFARHGARDPHHAVRRIAENQISREPRELSTACVVIVT